MSATEFQSESAIIVLERMIDAARNGNQAGEDAVVVAANALDLLAAADKARVMIGARLDTMTAAQRECAINQAWHVLNSAVARAMGAA